MKKTIPLSVLLFLLLSSLFAQTNNQSVNNKTKSDKMENQAMKVISEFLTAVQHGNNQKLAELLHPSVEWDQPGNNRFSGIKKSASEVFQMVGGMFQLTSNTLALTDIKVIAVNANSVACLVHWKGEQPVGAILDVDNIDVYTVENGKIVKAKVYSASIEQEDDFWGK
ncbi:nuclear transport factor 2 family protein [Chitinophagaceae bacterium LWZ2-11]